MRIILLLVVCLATLALPYSYAGIHWYNPPPPVHYMINQNGTPDCTDEFNQLNNGHQDWTDVVDSFFVYTYDGTTPLMPTTAWGSPQSDGNNVSGWFESGWGSSSSTIAVNIVFYYPGPNNIIESDQDFNGVNFTWSDSGQAGRMDIWDIGAHESGHGLMLGDLYGGGDTQKTMYGYSSTGETLKRSLEPDDIAGCVFIYPNPGTGVNLTNFSAEPASGGNLVRWQANENSSHVGYNLYRREGAGTTNTDVRNQGFVKVNANLITGTGVYSFLDHYRGGSTVQYVLADVDTTGHEVFHGPINCNSGALTFSLTMKVAPNPARTTANIMYTLPGVADSAANAHLRIYDLSGRMVANLPVSAQAGEGSLSWDTSAVPTGIYIASLSSGSGRCNSKIIVAH